jgi:class 3 adenylate cyclase
MSGSVSRRALRLYAGFTTLAEQLDPEEAHRPIDRGSDLIIAEVRPFQEAIKPYRPERILVLFRAVIAYEDSLHQAVHSALENESASREYSEELRFQPDPILRMHIRLNTDPAVVGKIADDLRMNGATLREMTNPRSTRRPGLFLPYTIFKEHQR